MAYNHLNTANFKKHFFHNLKAALKPDLLLQPIKLY